MTKPELLERVKRQLNLPAESEIDIAACVLQAKGAVAYQVMRDDERRGLLQQAYSVPLNGSGEGDLLAAAGSVTTNTGEILAEGVKFGLVLDADGNVLQPLTHYLDFVRPQPTVYAYYLIKNKATIATRALDMAVNGPADIQSVSGPLSITASFEPDEIDDFPPETEPDLVNETCKIFLAKAANANAGS